MQILQNELSQKIDWQITKRKIRDSLKNGLFVAYRMICFRIEKIFEYIFSQNVEELKSSHKTIEGTLFVRLTNGNKNECIKKGSFPCRKFLQSLCSHFFLLAIPFDVPNKQNHHHDCYVERWNPWHLPHEITL